MDARIGMRDRRNGEGVAPLRNENGCAGEGCMYSHAVTSLGDFCEGCECLRMRRCRSDGSVVMDGGAYRDGKYIPRICGEEKVLSDDPECWGELLAGLYLSFSLSERSSCAVLRSGVYTRSEATWGLEANGPVSVWDSA